MEMPNHIACDKCTLIAVTPSNVWFLEELFRFDDIKKFYVRRAEHTADIKSFCQYIVTSNVKKISLSYIMFNDYGNEVGFISADPMINNDTGLPVWNVGYAVHPEYRRQGYATSAVMGLSDFLLHNFSFQQVMLDISIDNVASTNVAKKCAFSKPDDRKGFYDMEHPEVGMRFRWFKQLPGNRSSLFNQAVHYYRQKAYTEAADAFKKALNEPYIPGTPFTDAQICSNLGMALSSMRCYNEAFQCLKKAQRLGLNNPSIEQELLWLKNNIGLF